MLGLTAAQMVQIGKLALAFGRINRATFHEDGVTPESDTDHTIMLGLVCCALATPQRRGLPRRSPILDVGRIAELVLVHDLVEAIAGDTPTAFPTPEVMADKKEREERALEQLKEEFADIPWLLPTLLAYEAQEEPEARFVRFVDKAMPKITHALNACATIRQMGKTQLDLMLEHDAQLARLCTEYPELADSLGPLMEEIMHLSEGAYPEPAPEPVPIHYVFKSDRGMACDYFACDQDPNSGGPHRQTEGWSAVTCPGCLVWRPVISKEVAPEASVVMLLVEQDPDISILHNVRDILNAEQDVNRSPFYIFVDRTKPMRPMALLLVDLYDLSLVPRLQFRARAVFDRLTFENMNSNGHD